MTKKSVEVFALHRLSVYVASGLLVNFLQSVDMLRSQNAVVCRSCLLSCFLIPFFYLSLGMLLNALKERIL